MASLRSRSLLLSEEKANFGNGVFFWAVQKRGKVIEGRMVLKTETSNTCQSSDAEMLAQMALRVKFPTGKCLGQNRLSGRLPEHTAEMV